MHLHIMGICGTFMGSLALLAKEMGHHVSGCDANVYPPMSTQLEENGVKLMNGYEPSHLDCKPDLIIVGNAMSRGNPMVEAVLNRGLPYTSGPQWLAEHVLQNKWVLAVAGTHGKTTTSTMLTWILEHAGLRPGYLIGGVPKNFSSSARMGESDFFVVEADEYDSAFFDKRSKFVHYRPRTAILNNLEYDHADIFPDIAAIQRQFHHLIRIIPSEGRIIMPANDEYLQQTLDMGCWTPVERFAISADDPSGSQAGDEADWQLRLQKKDGSRFDIVLNGENKGQVNWSQTGDHNVMNGLAAIAAARHVGVNVETAIDALQHFEGVKRRMELLATVAGVEVYDDFAHHPTAIATTLSGLREKIAADAESASENGFKNRARIIAVIEPRSNTMRLGEHQSKLAPSTDKADKVYWYQPAGLNWNLDAVLAESKVPAAVFSDITTLISDIVQYVQPADTVVIMSNGGFEGIHGKLLAGLKAKFEN